MTTPAMPAVPALPGDAIRQALDAGEWDTAAELLGEHERAVREALDDHAPDAGTRDSWLSLLTAQRNFLAQLKSARSEAAQSLQQLKRDRRGARAYLDGGDAAGGGSG